MTNTIPSQRILVVDDEPTVRETIGMLLKVDGHHVKAVNSGAEALAELAKRSYDFVFTDHVMRGMSGEELARVIKTTYPFQIVVMLTGYGEVLEQLTREGPRVDFILAKPIDMPLLRLMLLRLASQKTHPSQEKAAGSKC